MTARLHVTDTPVAGVKLVERAVVSDDRGYFTRLFCADELRAAGWGAGVAQINHSVTRHQGTVRGMHFQRPPHAELKLVTCVRGAVWDVAVDVRAGSPTWLHWTAHELSADNRRALLVPQGCAHGFQALTDDCELVYVHSAPYVTGAEGGLHPLDARLGITWPLPISRMSDRDRSQRMLEQGEEIRL